MTKSLRLSATLAAMLLVACTVFSNTYTVINTSDSGAGSLRQAITDANANAGPDNIVFNIPGGAPWSITVSSLLPTLTGPTVIDGTTQPGFSSGTQSTYIKVGTAFAGGAIFQATGITGITIKGLDLSYSSPRGGAGIGFTNCKQTFILDNYIRNRRTGIVINGGQDHTVQNNDLLASGDNSNEPCIYLLNITPGSIPSGVAMSGNKFGGSANMGFRFDNMSNLLIGDASVGGANIVIEDNSGFTAMGQGGYYMLWFNSCNNITIDNVDLSWLTGGVSNSQGIIFSNQVTNSTFTVKNCAIKNRYSGINAGNGKDITILNNDLRGSGHEDSYAVNLNNITEANVNGGILMSGNTWGRNPGVAESNGGLRLSNTNNLIIGDENTGVHIKIEDSSGFNTIAGNNANRNPIYLENVSNITVDNVDASWSLGGVVNCIGVRVQNSGSNGNITIKNCKVQNRYYGIYCSDGKDYTITGNDLRGCGHENLYALYLLNIAEGMIPGGVSVSGNLWGRNTGVAESHGGLYIADMSNLIIGDATTGVHIKIEDNSGFNTILGNEGSYRGALLLERVSNITVDNVDASWSPGGIANAFGIFVQNETVAYSSQTTSHRNVTIKNCDFRNRGMGIRIRGGKDYTVTGNDLRGCGEHGHHALQLVNIQPGTLSGGILAHTNKFGTGAAAINSGIYIERMSDLSIGDAATGGNFKIEDNSGLNQIVGNDVNSRGALYLNQVSNVTVNSVDCSYSLGGQAGNSWGIRVANTASHSNISIINCNAGNRGRGIWIDNGRDYTITGNNMVGSGNGNPAFELSNIIPGSLTGGILASGNTFGTPSFHRGIAISNMRDLLIGDASVSGANIVLEDNCGLNQCVGADYNSHGALYLSNVNNVTVDNVDCSKSTAGAGNSYGIVVGNGANNQGVTIKNCKADNRYRGIYCSGGKDYTVQNNTITNSGWDGTACALDFRDITAGTLPGGVLVSGNTFGNVPITANVSRAGVRFDNMRDLYIGDATTGGNVKLEDASGLTEVGVDQNSIYVVLNLNNINNSTIDNLNLSYSGTNQVGNAIRISNGASQGTVTIKDCTINKRRLGIYAGGGRDYTITGNNLTGTGQNSSADINNGGPAVWLNGLVKGTLDGGIAMSGNTFGGANANCALRIDDMRGFTIGDAASDDIRLEDGTSGLINVGNNATSNDFVLYLRQIADVTVNSVDLTRAGGSQLGGGIRVDNNNGQKNVTLSNNSAGNRRTGIYISGGSDYTVTGNTLTGSGQNEGEPALYLNGITPGTLPGGVSVSANTFGGANANTAARFENLEDLVIGNASVTGRNVTFEDGTSGLTAVGNNATSNESVLLFSNVTNSSINSVNLTRTGGTQYGRGIYVANGNTAYPFSITNCAAGNRRTGIYLAGGRDYTVQNNSLTGSGNNASEPALYLGFLTVNSNLVINNNTFGGSNFHTGIRVESTSDLLISDGTVSGTHVGVTTANGLGNATGYAVYLANVNRMKIQNMNLSFTTATKTGVGIQVTTNGGSTSLVEMKSLIVKNRVDGINLASGAGHSVKCSDLSDNTDGLDVASGVTGFVCEQNSFVGNASYAINSAAAITAENNYFGGGAPPVGTPNGVTASVDATPFLASAPANCPSTMAAYLELKGNQNLILNGSTTPNTINYTDFGSVKTNTPITRTFTINNTGGVALNVTSISFTGGDAGDFSAGALTPASPVPAGGSATFTITFTPGATGLRSTTLSIVNDDPNNNPFTAALRGTGKNVLVVTKTTDTNDGVCDADCSLREAITVANSNADADVIEFNIGGGGAQTITHTTAFPNITQPLTIDGSSQPGFAGTPLITVNSNNNFTTFTATNVTGLTIKYLDLSRPATNYDGNGIFLSSCNEVFILNNVIKNRILGILSSGGRDHTIQNNDLRQTGADLNNPAIYLNSVGKRDVPGGVKLSGNQFGDATGNNRSRFGIRINTMSDLLIGDASVANAHITIEDLSGMASTGTGDNYCLYLNNVSNTTVDNLDLTATTYGTQGWGIVVGNSASYGNVTIKNCKINNRYSGIYCSGGRDYTVQGNDLQKTGNDASRPSLWFQNVTPGALPTGILASGNTFGDAGGLTRTGLRVDGATGLLIGNQTVVGAHITIEDNSGMKAAGTGDNYAVYLVNVSNTTVDKLDLTSTIGYQGWGLVVGNSANNSNVTIQNCKINGRYSGIYCIGGKDYTILNNDLKNTGNDNTRPALYLNGIRPGTLPGGATASGNSFGFVSQSAQTALRVDNMDGLVIGDASVGGAHIVIEDASGANAMSNNSDNAVIYLSAVSNLTVDNVDISRSTAGRSGAGIWVENVANTIYRNVNILNCNMKQRDMSLYINGGKDVTVTNNDMRYSGYYQDRPALFLTNIQSGTLPGGVSMSGNTFGGTFNGATSQSGIRMDNMRDLVMADAAAPGVNIVLEDNCGLNNVYGDEVNQRGVMYMNNVRNVQISSIDLSKITAGQGSSYALKVNNGVNVGVLNGKGSNRYHGYYFEGGRDITVTGNDLTTSGNQRDYPALRFSNIQPGSVNTANGIAASGNTFGGANVRTGLRIDNMKNLLIGDASVGGAHVVIEDNSGLNNITQADGNSENPAIFLASVSDITVDNVDASRPSGQDMGGIWVSNSISNSNITIKNCNFNRHRRAIFCSGGKDYTIQNNTLLHGGSTNDQPAIYLQNIQQGNLTGGILMSGNTFGGTSSLGGIRFENMRDLSIGDAATGGNVKIEDNSGFNNMGGNAGGNSAYYVLHFVNVNNAKVDNVDLSRPVGATPAQDFTGIRVDNGASYGPITIKDCNISRHRTGISAQNGKDYTVTGNDLRGCGAGSEEPALYFNNITQQDGTVPMGILAHSNTFGTVNSVVTNCAIRLDNLCGIRISDGSVANSHIKLESTSGIKEVTGTGGNNPAVIAMINTSGMAVEKLDLEFTGAQTGTGIRFQNSNASQYDFKIKDNLLKNRRMGVYIANGSDYTVSGNNFQMTGAADDEPAIRLEHVAEGVLYGGVSMSGNTFGGTGAAFGLKFVNMSNLKISDGSFPGTNVNLGAWATNGIGQLTTGNVLHLSGICNATVRTLDLSRSGTTRQGTGLRLSNGMGNTIEKVFVQGRDAGIQINGTVSEVIQCNVLYDNNFGFDFVNNAAIRSMTFQNNSMHCNTTALRNQLPASFGALNVPSNYWGTATGPTNLGGTGNGYTNTNGGSVNAGAFLTAAAACAPALPNADALGNNVVIEDGDMSPAINDNTLVCGTDVGQTLTATYSIKNNGTGTIRLDGASPVNISPASPVFSVGSQPADLELAAGESTTFTINFTPNALGTFTANVNIENRTCDNDPYNFTVQGQGCSPYTATLSGTPAICAGQSATIALNITGGLAPFTVTLSDGSSHTVNATGSSSLTVSPSMTTAYTITSIYDANNCCATNAGSATVTVHALPTPAIVITETSGNTSHDGILCSGASAALDAGAYTMYAWMPAGNTQTLNAAVAGTYTVTVTDGNGCQNTASATIVVNPNPTPTIVETDNSGTADDNIICTGGTAMLDAGVGYTSYAWAPSGSNQTLLVSTGGTYTVVVTDTNGCTGTDDQAIQENALPVAALSGALLVCPGTTSTMINLNITSGVAPFTVTLSDASVHNVPASGMSQLTVTVAGPATNSFTITSITGADVCSNAGSGTATVDFDSPGEIEVKGNGVVIPDGDLMPGLSDYTDFGNVDLCGNRVRTFTIYNTGNFTLNISSITSSSSNFTIGGAPTSILAGNSATFTVTFSATATGVASATITINNSDCDEGVYDFGVTGTGVPPFNQWTQLGGDINGEAAGDNSGYSVSLSGDGTIMAIGARNNDGSGTNAGHARIYQYNGAAWVQLGTDINGEAAGDLFGYSVAISSDGTRVAIGGVLNDGGGTDAGHVRVYEYNGSTWIQLGNDIDGESTGDESGRSVSLSADGSVVAIGAIWNDGGGNGAGQVRVYQFASGNWIQIGADINGEAAGDNAGFSVSLSSDGTKVAVGAYQNDGNGGNSGQARVYQYNGSAWMQIGADLDGENAGDSFGTSVSLSSDGTKLAVGADANDGTGTDAGHVRVFQFNGSNWIQIGADIDGEAAGDELGYSVSLSSDGAKLAAGGRRNDGNGSNAGHVRVFQYNGSVWAQIAADINGEAAGDETGNSVSLSSDGTVVAAGAQANNGNGTEAGHARVFAVSNQPEANVKGNGVDIADGDATPSTTDHTDFGLVAVNGNLVRTFTIFNTGNTALTIGSITSDNAKFVVSGAPASVAAGNSATFTVTFNPTATGLQTSTITINNNDCDEQPYDFAVQGTGAEPGAALNFDGTNDFVAAPDAGNLDLGSNLTLEAWVKPESFSEYNMIIDKRDLADVSANYGLTLNYGKPMFYFWNGGNLSFHIATNAIALNTFTHLAATYDGAKVRIFVNGTQVYAQAETDVPPSNNQPLSIGRNQVTLQYFDGSIDEVRIWNTVRSCEEIGQLYTCELSVPQPGLVAYYKFNQGFANGNNSGVATLIDAAGGDNNGTLNNFALTGVSSNWVTPGGVTTGTSCPAAITAPEADLLGHDNTPLANGTTGTSVAQGTNLGSVNLGSSSTAKTFTIRNNGTAALNVSSIAVSDPQFTLTALSPAGPIPAGMSATFTLTFTPTALGAQNATITINTDDCDEATYTFAVTGTGACVAPSFTTCPAAPVTATTATGTCAAPVNYTVTEAGIPAPVLSYAFAGATTGSGSGTGTGSTFNKGNTIVTVTATSICSPPATCSFTVTVTDNEKPQITCAGPVTVNTTAGLCTGTATLTAPTVTDNCPFGGNGLNFDGNDDQVVTEAYSGTSFTGDLTLECWFKGSSLNGRSLFGRGYQQEFDLALWSNQLNYYHGNGSVWVNPTFSYVFADNTWYHVAVVRNASAQTVSLYVNGVFQQTLSYGAPLPVAQTAAFRIGRRVVGNPFLGSIDEVRVWTVARTPAQIATNWNQELTAQPGLFALYHLNEGSANGNNPGLTTAADASGNAHDGTLTNFALSGTSSNWVVGAFGGVTNNAPATYPKGNTTVTWTATDASGNTETCQQTVTVTDNQPPTVSCPSNQTVPPTISSPCSAVVNAINASYNDNCTGTTLAYTLSGATTASGAGQASGQTFMNGVTTVTYTVTDGASLTSACMFTVTVTNCNLLFSGTILWEDDAVSGVKDATVNITGASSGSDATDVNGDFEAAVPYATGNFTVKPVKNINRLNGVTAADALAIQQHLTNINPITNPYKMIAADVNRNNGLSTIDATIINQCLLGNPAANNIFNVFWRFVPQTWTPLLPPWGFPEQINLTGVSTNQSGLDFYGVKIGDVTAAYANPANFGAGEPLVWRVQDRVLQAGETVQAEFRADQLDDVAAMQFALQFDPSVLQFDGVEILGGLPVSMENFGLFNISEGEIRVVWTGEKGLPIPEAAAVFRLRFAVREGGGRLSEVLGLNDEALAGRVYNSALAESGVMLRFGEASGAMGGEPGAPGWSLHAMPNPFSKQTTISFTLAETTEAQLRIFNPEGRELWRLDKTYPAGYHEETVRLEDLDASGLLFYELTTARGKQTKKLVAVRL